MRMEMSWIVCCVLQGYQTVQTMFDDREMLDRCVRALCHHHYYGIRANLLQEWSSSLQQCSNNWRISNKEQWSCYVQWWLTTTIKHFILIFPFLAPLLGLILFCHCRMMNFRFFENGLITIPRLTGSNRCFYKIIIIIIISLSCPALLQSELWSEGKRKMLKIYFPAWIITALPYWPTWLIFIIYFFIFLPLSYYNQNRQDRGIGRERKRNDKLGKKLTQKRKTERKDTKSAAGKKRRKRAKREQQPR